MKLFIACATLLSLANGQDLTAGCGIIVMGSTLIDPEVSDTGHTSFDCVLDSADAGGVSNLSYPLELSVSQAEEMTNLLNRGDIVSGSTTLSSPASLQNNFIVPSASDSLSFTTSTIAKNREGPCHEGIKPILAVRVTDKNGLVQVHSPRVISDKIFGTDGDLHNLASQMYACSFKKLTISTDYTGLTNNDIITVEPGVIEVTIPISIEENDKSTIRNAVTEKVQEQLGFELPGPFDQVMYILEKCYGDCGWAAYAFINSWNSVFQGGYYKSPGVQMHEIGHNFGLAHSGGLNKETYTDHTCLMGNPLYADEEGQMCYNPAKSWQIGWYKDSVSILDITQSSVNHVQTIIGVADYGNNDARRDVVIKLETGSDTDYFVGFNRATGINAQNDEADDEVTIIETGQNGESFSQSYLKATLKQGESYTVKNVQVTVENIDISTDPGTARISFQKGSSPVISPNQPPVTNPVREPGNRPVREPGNRPVREPGNRPVREPRNRPVGEPGTKPVREPRNKPVREPATKPGVKPVTKPVTKPVREPATKPGVKPVTKPVTGPVTKPVREPGNRPVREPDNRPVREPGNRPVREPDNRPVREPGTKPVREPGNRPVREPGTKPVREPGTKPVREPGNRPVREPGTKPVREPGTKPVIKPVTEPTISPVKDPFNCDVTKYLLKVQIQNDNESSLKYVVQRKNRNKWAKRKDMKYIVKTTTPHEEVKCVPRKLCYRFKIIDRIQRDGLKTGGYKIIYNDELIKDSKFEKGGMEWIKFGEGCD